MMIVPAGVKVRLCLFTKRIDQGGFVWLRMVGHEGSITLSPAQLA